MPVYGKDAYDDERFVTSPWDVQGLFWRLCWWQWREGSIPADVELVVAVTGKPRETRRLFKKVREFFVKHPDLTGRLYNVTLDGHRQKAFSEKERKGVGAELTNAKRIGQRTGQRDAERPAEQHATRDASANALGFSSKGEGAGEGRPLTPQQADVKRVLDALEDQTTDFLVPTGGLVARWLRDFGIDAILATIVEEGKRGNLDGRDPSYLFKCIDSYKRRPRERTEGSGRSGSEKSGKRVPVSYASAE